MSTLIPRYLIDTHRQVFFFRFRVAVIVRVMRKVKAKVLAVSFHNSIQIYYTLYHYFGTIQLLKIQKQIESNDDKKIYSC